VIALLPFSALAVAGVLDADWGRGPRLRGRVAVGSLSTAAVAAILLALVAPRWFNADSYAMSGGDQVTPLRNAEGWVARNVDHRARILVDDTLYVDLVRSGFRERFGVVWFYKLDFTHNLDPSVARQLPNGWKSFDYVVSTGVIRSALAQNQQGMTQVRGAMANSRVVAVFGRGASRVEIRRVVGPGTGSGLLPRKQSPVAAKKARHPRASHTAKKARRR
jgi:hypothetical protein